MTHKITMSGNLTAEIDINGTDCPIEAAREAEKAFEQKINDLLHDKDITLAGDNSMTATMLCPTLEDVQRV